LSRRKLDLGTNVRAMILTTAPALTSHSLVLIGGLQRGDTEGRNRFAAIHLDFSYMQTRQCSDDDVEKWYAQGANGTDCIMGQKVFGAFQKPYCFSPRVLAMVLAKEIRGGLLHGG
jgi:hypothetical protein